MNESHAVRLNQSAATIFDAGVKDSIAMNIRCGHQDGGVVVDAGIETTGSLAAGIWLSELCMSGLGEVTLASADADKMASQWAVNVTTDQPVAACLASQYAGWPVSSDSFFAMGSGPMRLARGREPMLESLSLVATAESLSTPLVGVLESEVLPDSTALDAIADQCDVSTSKMRIAVAPSYSLAGNIQVVARSVETAMHKLHELEFDVRRIVSAAGTAPLPPVAKRGDTIGGIGRTNDAILYGGTVTFWTDAEDDAIGQVIARVPSGSSDDHGRPFAEIFKSYDHDFYKVDPMLFSPARVVMHSLISGRTFAAGNLCSKTLEQSFS